MAKQRRIDRVGENRTAFDKNKKIIYATQTVCGICGKPVDFSLKRPDPMSPCIDHIIPISRGGHPSDINNLQLAHYACNAKKSNKMQKDNFVAGDATITNRNLPLSCDWKNYRG